MNRYGYREAVEKGINALGVREYSPSCRSAFRIAAREFEGYMEGLGLTYSPQLAQQLVNECQGYWKPHNIKSARKAMHIVADIIEHGRITTSLQNPKDRRPSYPQLPPSGARVRQGHQSGRRARGRGRPFTLAGCGRRLRARDQDAVQRQMGRLHRGEVEVVLGALDYRIPAILLDDRFPFVTGTVSALR